MKKALALVVLCSMVPLCLSAQKPKKKPVHHAARAKAKPKTKTKVKAKKSTQRQMEDEAWAHSGWGGGYSYPNKAMRISSARQVNYPPCRDIEMHAIFRPQGQPIAASLHFTGKITNISMRVIPRVDLMCRLGGFLMMPSDTKIPPSSSDEEDDLIALMESMNALTEATSRSQVFDSTYQWIRADTYFSLKPGETREINSVVSTFGTPLNPPKGYGPNGDATYGQLTAYCR
jgi:hypothetical protein